MQGRLLTPEPGRFQAFPPQRWEDEIARAPEAGIDGIEFIYEVHGEEVNPLRDDAGLARLRAAREAHSVAVASVCADWFMERRLIDDPRHAERLRWLAARAAAAGIERVVVPFVDNSRLTGPAEADAAVRALASCLPAFEDGGVELHLETDLAPAPFAALLARLDHDLVKANYDSGNSSGLGYELEEEWEAYGDRIGSVHVKDRIRGGGTVPLGDGDADLHALMYLLRTRGWARPLVLQVARGPEGDEIAWVRAAAGRVRDLWSEAVAWT